MSKNIKDENIKKEIKIVLKIKNAEGLWNWKWTFEDPENAEKIFHNLVEIINHKVEKIGIEEEEIKILKEEIKQLKNDNNS